MLNMALRKHTILRCGVRNFALLTMLTLMTGCVGAKSKGHHECAWIERVILSDGWEDRLTRDEKLQITGHNENVIAFCR
jgi:hypothetical protein